MRLPAHARRYPLALCLSTAAVILGFALVVAPPLAGNSPSLAIMPEWGIVLWGMFWLLGGTGAIYGMLTGRRDYESAGCTLQGFAYLAAVVSSAFSPDMPPSPLGLTFLFAIAAGFIWRSHSARGG